jgi:hypothetical protein
VFLQYYCSFEKIIRTPKIMHYRKPSMLVSFLPSTNSSRDSPSRSPDPTQRSKSTGRSPIRPIPPTLNVILSPQRMVTSWLRCSTSFPFLRRSDEQTTVSDLLFLLYTTRGWYERIAQMSLIYSPRWTCVSCTIS